ncbi:hypothetical protein ILYODFUR_011943 [Ilyodon furcidens]|uniref:Uncharacterized protein n=1 Tax=Ilyodon furcidens TaxID=33524 RepID=A0ABV0USH9_9TELE
MQEQLLALYAFSTFLKAHFKGVSHTEKLKKYSWSSASVGFSMSAYCRLNPHHFATDDSSYFAWFCRRFLLVELFFSTVALCLCKNSVLDTWLLLLHLITAHTAVAINIRHQLNVLLFFSVY